MIGAEKANFQVTRMCRLLEVDRRRYYEWARRLGEGVSARQARMESLAVEVKRFHKESGGTYGAPRLLACLRDAGWAVSVKTVAKVMRLAGLTGISPRSWRVVTTVPGGDPCSISDLVVRRFDMGARDKAWFSDITFLRTGQGWAYCCVVRDGHTRRVLGRTVAGNMGTSLVEAALRQAVSLRGQLPGKVIFHADRGCQFTSQQLAVACASLGVLQSVGRTGVCLLSG